MDLIELIEVNTISKAYLLRSLLESNGINAVLKDEQSLSLQQDILSGINGIKILVDKRDVARAKKIISEMK